MASVNAPHDDLDALRRENEKLRAELRKRTKSEKRAKELKQRALATSGSLLFTIFDRKKIITNAMRLSDTLARYSESREKWPSREEIAADVKALSLSWVRFAVRRRFFVLLLSLAAFFIPAIQLYLVFQQNEIIENQNELFEIQVYDLVARSMTSGQLAGKQVTGALLARSDLDFLEGVVTEVFGTDMGVAFTAEDIDARARRMRDAAFRGHLILGIARAIELRHESQSPTELQSHARPMFAKVLRDATLRVPELLRFSRDDVLEDPALAEEVYRYLFNLSTLMRKQWSLVLAVNETDWYFTTIAPLLNRASSRRMLHSSGSSPLATVFFQQAVRAKARRGRPGAQLRSRRDRQAGA